MLAILSHIRPDPLVKGQVMHTTLPKRCYRTSIAMRAAKSCKMWLQSKAGNKTTSAVFFNQYFQLKKRERKRQCCFASSCSIKSYTTSDIPCDTSHTLSGLFNVILLSYISLGLEIRCVFFLTPQVSCIDYSSLF